MAQGKVTTGYGVDPRTVDGKRVYAVMRQYTFRGNAGAQLVTIYSDEITADSVAATLKVSMRREV